MTMPGFGAEAALSRSNMAYTGSASSASTGATVVPQDCNIAKGAGCFIGPISWCALSSLGDATSFCDCVDRASGGHCIDCTACAGSGLGLDPRGRGGEASLGNVGSGRFGLTTGSWK